MSRDLKKIYRRLRKNYCLHPNRIANVGKSHLISLNLNFKPTPNRNTFNYFDQAHYQELQHFSMLNILQTNTTLRSIRTPVRSVPIGPFTIHYQNFIHVV
jgi:hypothetical protein